MKSVIKKAAALLTAFTVVSGLTDGAAVYAASAADAQAYISILNGYLDTLYIKMRKCKRAGIATDYEQVTYSVLERWAKQYLNDDIENGWLSNFDSYTKPELDRMYKEANQNLDAYLDGSKTAFSVPKYVSSDMETDGFTVTAQTVDSNGEESRRPVFFTGFGHFEDAAMDIPKFQSFGLNTIQNEIGPNSVIVDNMAWNVSHIGNVDASARLCESEKHSGDYSLKIQNKTTKLSGVYLDVVQEVQLRPSTAYTISFWVKANNASGIQISYNGGQNRFLIDGGTYDWKKYSFNFITDSMTTSGKIWILSEDTTDALYIDDIELYRSNSTENLAKNGSFDEYVPSADEKYYVYANGADSTVTMLKNAEDNNIAVSLLISPHYFPSFLLEKYPEICGENGKFIPHAQKTFEILAEYIATIMPKIKDFKSLNNICVSNEPSFCPADYGDFYKSYWTEFLKDKYNNSIKSLNLAYGAEYTDWSEPELQSVYDNTALGYDNRLFARQMFSDWHKFLANSVHKYAPNVPVHAKGMGYIGTHELFDIKLDSNADYELFDEFSDLAGCDYSIEWSGIEAGVHKPLAESLWYDYLAGVSEKSVINSEDHMYVDGEENFTSEQRLWMQTNVWQGAVHHRSFSQIWTWRKSYNTKSIYYGSMLFRPDCIEAIGKTNLDLNRLSYEVSALANSAEDVAVLYSSASRQYNKNHMYSVYNAYEASLFNGKKVRIVTENQLEKLNDCKVLILADCTNLPKKAAEAVCRFDENGGKTVILGAAPLAADENNAALSGYSEKIQATAEVIPNNIDIAKWLEKYYNRNGLQKVLITDASTDERVENTEWTYTEYNGGLLVNVCNYDMDTTKSVKISVNGRNITAAKELRESVALGETFLLQPYKSALIYISGTQPKEADNIRLEVYDDQKMQLCWETNDNNVTGVSFYRYDENGKMTKIASSESKNVIFDTPSDTDAVVVKTYNIAGTESFGKTVAYSTNKLFDVSCTAQKIDDTVKCSVSVTAKKAAAGTIIVLLKDKYGRIIDAASVGKIANGAESESFDAVFGSGCEGAKTAEVFVAGGADGKNEISNRVTIEL